MSKCNHVERDPNVDPLLLSGQKRVLRAIRQSHRAVPVPKRPAVDEDTLSPHRRELVGPEEMPSAVIADIRNPGVEAYLGALPSLSRANFLGERRHVEVGVGIAECFASSVEEVLAIHKGNCALDGRLAVQWPIGEE